MSGSSRRATIGDTPVTYRRALLGDVPRLVGLPLPGEAGGDPRMAKYLAGDHHPLHALPARAVWLAEAGTFPLGYVAGHLTRRFGCNGELQWIYVIPDARRRGVASHLLTLLASWFDIGVVLQSPAPGTR